MRRPRAIRRKRRSAMRLPCGTVLRGLRPSSRPGRRRGPYHRSKSVTEPGRTGTVHRNGSVKGALGGPEFSGIRASSRPAGGRPVGIGMGAVRSEAANESIPKNEFKIPNGLAPSSPKDLPQLESGRSNVVPSHSFTDSQASGPPTTRPWTSVRRKLRPWNRKASGPSRARRARGGMPGGDPSIPSPTHRSRTSPFPAGAYARLGTGRTRTMRLARPQGVARRHLYPLGDSLGAGRMPGSTPQERTSC